MMYEIRLRKPVEKDVAKWKKSNPRLHKKFKDILNELTIHPRTGIGHPEPLKGGRSIMLKFDSVEELRKHLASL